MIDADSVYAKVGARAELFSRKNGLPQMAITGDDEAMVREFIEKSSRDLLVNIGTIRSDEEEIQPEVLTDNVPDELEESLILDTLSRWCNSVGAVQQGQLFKFQAEEERKKYRFDARALPYTTRPYRMS